MTVVGIAIYAIVWSLFFAARQTFLPELRSERLNRYLAYSIPLLLVVSLVG